MKMTAHKLTSCLWFDTQAEEAANFYVSIFEGAKIGRITRYGKEGQEIHGKAAGSVLTVEFDIAGQTFVALNGGPEFNHLKECLHHPFRFFGVRVGQHVGEHRRNDLPREAVFVPRPPTRTLLAALAELAPEIVDL